MSVSKELKKGAFVNFFGVVGKMAAPAFLIIVNRLYGPEIFGIYITANIAIEIIIAFLTSGFKDGALIFVSRFSDSKNDQQELYTALSNAFLWSVGLSLLVFTFSILFGAQLLEMIYQDEFSSSLITIFQIMILSIPLMAFERIVLASTQGLKIMKYDAINNGWIRPIALLIFSILFWFVSPTVTGMALAYFSCQALLFLISLVIYNKLFSWKKLLLTFRNFKINSELVEFAIPQSLNMTLNRFITGIDILMLPAFGFGPAVVGFYGAGSMLIREIRSVKMIFSTAFNPFIVRLHKENKFEELSHHFSKTASWITTIAFPIILLITVFKDHLLILIHPEYGGDSSFMFYLLPIPYLYCSFSLAGNIVAMTGHSKLNLMNSFIVASSNIALNLLLIPEFGIIGAASASAMAMFILICFEMAEARFVAKAKMYFKEVFRAHLAGFAATAFLLFSYLNTFENFEFIKNPFVQTIGIILIVGGILGIEKISRLRTKLR